MKFSSEGKQMWVALYHGTSTGNYSAAAISADPDGGVTVTGDGVIFDLGMHTVKYDKNGQEVWTSVFESQRGAFASAITTGSNGLTYVAGAIIFSDLSFAVVAYDKTGHELWNDEVQGRLPSGRDWEARAIGEGRQSRHR